MEQSANKISKEQQHQQQQQQQSNTLQSNSKEKPSNDAVNEMSTNNIKKKVFIIGDSMIKKVDGYLLTNSIKHKYLVKVRPFLAAKTVGIFDNVKQIQRDSDPDVYILHIDTNDRSSRPEVLLGKNILKICSEFTGERLCGSAIAIKLLYNFIEIALRHGCSPVYLLYIFRTPFSEHLWTAAFEMI